MPENDLPPLANIVCLKKSISHTRGMMEISATIKDLMNMGGGRMVLIISPFD